MANLTFKTICLLALGAVFIGSPIGANASVWESAKAAAYSLNGKIKQVSADGQNVWITVQVDKNKTETMKVCRSHVGGDVHNQIELALVKSAIEAQESGKRISLAYEGPFNRCISALSQ